MSRPLLARTPLLPVVVLLLVASCGRPGQGPGGSAPLPGPAPSAPPTTPTTPASPASLASPAIPATEASSATAAPAVALAPARAALSAEERQTLVGWWQRYDKHYMIVIESVGEDGRLTARYLNPDPVGVSKAEAWKEKSRIEVLVELTDANYPGNFYELSLDPERQQLVGVYHHLGAREDYEVYFTRFEDAAPEPAVPR